MRQILCKKPGRAPLKARRIATDPMPTNTATIIDSHTVARDAADLLTGDLRRVKRCPDHDCLWLFHDGSKNLSRRWCAMHDCGARDKVGRFRGRADYGSRHRTHDRAVDRGPSRARTR